MTTTDTTDILNAPLGLLTDTQIWGGAQRNGQLQVMQDYGRQTDMSDLAVLLGGFVSGSYKASNDKPEASVWSASSEGLGCYVRTVNSYGNPYNDDPSLRYLGVRPALPSSVASKIGLSVASLPTETITGWNGKRIQVVKYGEYPQTMVPSPLDGMSLQQALDAGTLTATGKTYTFDAETSTKPGATFNPDECREYEHQNGSRYICVKARPFEGTVYVGDWPIKTGDMYWVKVEPIEWLVEPEGSKDAGMMVTKKALVSGWQFSASSRYSDADDGFKKTNMHTRLNTEFYRDSGLQELLQKAQASAQEETMWAKHAALQSAPPRTFDVPATRVIYFPDGTSLIKGPDLQLS